MKMDADLDDFLRAARKPAVDPEAGKDSVRARLAMALGPLAFAAGSAALSPAVASPPGLLGRLVRYKTGLLVAGSFTLGVASHAGFEHATSRTVPAPIIVAAPVAAPAPLRRPEPAVDDVPVRDVETLPCMPTPVASPESAPAQASSARAESPTDRGDLAAEQVLLETARTALGRHDATHAIAALERHRQRFPAGQLSEERESLTVVALVAERRLDDARARTASFHHQFNQSLQGPMLDALIRDGDPAK